MVLTKNKEYILYISLIFSQEKYRDGNGQVTGLGYDYRSSVKLSLERLLGILNLQSGKIYVCSQYNQFEICRGPKKV